MTRQQLDDLCQLIHHYARLKIDNMLLSSILLKSETTENPPVDWLKELRLLRELPVHRASLEETEQLVSLIRQTAHEDALMTLISCIPKSTLPD